MGLFAEISIGALPNCWTSWNRPRTFPVSVEDGRQHLVLGLGGKEAPDKREQQSAGSGQLAAAQEGAPTMAEGGGHRVRGQDLAQGVEANGLAELGRPVLAKLALAAKGSYQNNLYVMIEVHAHDPPVTLNFILV